MSPFPSCVLVCMCVCGHSSCSFLPPPPAPNLFGEQAFCLQQKPPDHVTKAHKPVELLKSGPKAFNPASQVYPGFMFLGYCASDPLLQDPETPKALQAPKALKDP